MNIDYIKNDTFIGHLLFLKTNGLIDCRIDLKLAKDNNDILKVIKDLRIVSSEINRVADKLYLGVNENES